MLKKRKFIKCQHQRPPSNADILGSQLLGYRVFIKDLSCVLAKERGREVTDPCTETKTISDPDATSTKIGYLSESRSQINHRYHCCHFTESATEYELSVSGFTSKRTGSLSRPLLVTTDTAKSSPPLITDVNCTG